MAKFAVLPRLPQPNLRWHRAARPTPSRTRHAQAALAWSAAFLVLAAIIGNIIIDRYRLEAVDREYAQRLALLQTRMAETPERPLCLVVGSSRVVAEFAPEQLPTLTTHDGQTVLPFNFAHTGAGPMMSFVILNRAYNAGIRPRWVVMEIMPGFLPHESVRQLAKLTTTSDLLAAQGIVEAGRLEGDYLRARIEGLPSMARRAVNMVEPPSDYLPLGGFAPLPAEVEPARRNYLLALQAEFYGRGLADFRVSERADRALRRTVALCRAHGSEVRFVLTPEADEYRKMYGPGCQERMKAYAAALAGELGVPLTDARDWLEEADFCDSHHALQRGAAKFTARFHRDVLMPMVEAR